MNENTARSIEEIPAMTSPYVVPVENQVDFRTLRTSKNPEQSRKMRARRKELAALGLCTRCGTAQVQNRKNCKRCTDEVAKSTHRWVFRKYGVPLPPQLW